MKIEKQAAQFTPITITLETQEEVDQMFALANWCTFSDAVNITVMLFEQLESAHHKTYNKGTGLVFRLNT